MTFKEGGAFDFAATYERIKETLSHAMEMARESGRPQANLSDINTEQLPAYEEATGGPVLQRPMPTLRIAAPQNLLGSNGSVISSADERSTNPSLSGSSGENIPPNEPPPGYEETQQSSIAESLERSIRTSN